MGKVVHVSEDLHARLKRYCEEKGVSVQSWVSNLIVTAIDENRPVPVERKPQPQPSGDQNGEQSDAWQQPPFWKGGKN